MITVKLYQLHRGKQLASLFLIDAKPSARPIDDTTERCTWPLLTLLPPRFKNPSYAPAMNYLCQVLVYDSGDYNFSEVI